MRVLAPPPAAPKLRLLFRNKCSPVLPSPHCPHWVSGCRAPPGGGEDRDPKATAGAGALGAWNHRLGCRRGTFLG